MALEGVATMNRYLLWYAFLLLSAVAAYAQTDGRTDGQAPELSPAMLALGAGAASLAVARASRWIRGRGRDDT